ncbi:MAG: UDP-3-O-(3-hydroxymyristoyl)glucosamine N-acyltransferase [Gammaproteobacteria bacterium]
MSYSLEQIAREFSLEFSGDPDLKIVGLCGLSDDLEQHLSFVTADKYREVAAASCIPAFITRPDGAINGKTNLFHPQPEYAMAVIARLFAKPVTKPPVNPDPSALIDPSATISPDCVIGPLCVIGAHTEIGARTVVQAGSVIMDRVTIGEDCLIHPHCTICADSTLGDRVVVQPGAVIGGDGFGFVMHEGEHVKIPQLGNVVIESDVEIGANTTIDRGRFTATRIGRGTKIDNGVMVAHNVQIGERCLLVAQSGISGSTRLGDNVVLAGQVGLVGHIDIADNVTLLGQSMATKNINEAGV